MKISPKRPRSDSARAAITAAQDAAKGPLKPPEHVSLREGDLAFWVAIVTARARSSWNDADLCTAANMARCEADIERLQKLVDVEGDIVTAANGSPIINPKVKLVDTLSRRVVTLSRLLHVHPEATLGRARDSGNALALEKAAAHDDDDLIPRLRAV